MSLYVYRYATSSSEMEETSALVIEGGHQTGGDSSVMPTGGGAGVSSMSDGDGAGVGVNSQLAKVMRDALLTWGVDGENCEWFQRSRMLCGAKVEEFNLIRLQQDAEQQTRQDAHEAERGLRELKYREKCQSLQDEMDRLKNHFMEASTQSDQNNANDMRREKRARDDDIATLNSENGMVFQRAKAAKVDYEGKRDRANVEHKIHCDEMKRKSLASGGEQRGGRARSGSVDGDAGGE